MAVWESFEPGFDWLLVQNGFCSAIRSRSQLEAAVEWLKQRKYQVVRMNAENWADDTTLHDCFVTSLDFPAHYGRNLDALNDCLRDVAEIDYGWRAEDRGLVLVLDCYASLMRSDASAANAVLDIIEDTGRLAALFGNRIFCLVQVDDPAIEFGPVGGHDVGWNTHSWIDEY